MVENHPPLRIQFDQQYMKKVSNFADSVGDMNASGIPEPHIPLWGPLYEYAPLRVGIIGRDTRSWGDLPEFLRTVKESPLKAIHRNENEFNSLAFTDWTNNFGKTFWDTSMKILAGLHGIADWKRLKRREELAVLRSFFWANVNSIERYAASPKSNGVSWDVWRKIKDASEKHLDSFSAILDIFTPHVVVVMNWEPGDHFLDLNIKWNNLGDHLIEARHEATGTYILAAAHPTWLNQNSLYDTTITRIVEKATQAIKETSNLT